MARRRSPASRSPAQRTRAPAGSAAPPRGSLSSCSRSWLQHVRVVGHDLEAVVRADRDVLEPYAAVARAIQARLERDHVTRDKIVADPPEVRPLVHLEADPVAQAVEEAAVEHF